MSLEMVGRPMEILLVEDGLVHAKLAIEAVRRGNFAHRVTLVRDGQEALDVLFRRHVFRLAPRPDLILLDLRLPKMDGLDVLAEIRQDESLKAIPVVIMTASEDDKDRALTETLHVEAYLTKPLDLAKFYDLLKQLKHHWHADVMLPQAVAAH